MTVARSPSTTFANSSHPATPPTRTSNWRAAARSKSRRRSVDSRPFAAALAEAQARAAAARTAAALAQAELARALRLIPDEAVSREEVDNLRAAARSAQASIAAAEAVVRERALDLEFTHVSAPISGKISYRRVDPGSQVASGAGAAGTLLTTINAVDPIYFSFDVSEGLLLKAQRD